ncbi:MAG: hypothetical protein ACKVRP_12125 [Bacteroidota bacterium]
MKAILWLVIVVVIGSLVWAALGIWTGFYSLYSFPPSKEYKNGLTFLISRESTEPAFNSPDYTAPPRKDDKRKSGIGFADIKKTKRPILSRVVVKLPYMPWAYRKSVESNS